MNLKKTIMILLGVFILLAIITYLPGIKLPNINIVSKSPKHQPPIINIISKFYNNSKITRVWFNITIKPYDALIIGLNTLNGTLPRYLLPVNNILAVLQEDGRHHLIRVFENISSYNASLITPTGWSLFEAALSIAYLPYKCHSVILNPWPVDVKDRLNLTHVFINFTLCLPTRYFLKKLPYPPSGHVTSLSCEYTLVDKWTTCHKVGNETICHTHYIYQLTINEDAVIYNGSNPRTILAVDDHVDSVPGYKPSLSISYDIECVDSCDYSASVRSWIVDSYTNPLGTFNRTFLLFKGTLHFDGSKCKITGKYYHEPEWIFEGPSFTKKELIELVKEWTWLWIGVAIGRKMHDLTFRLLKGNWSRYWTYEYTWLTTLATCSMKPYMTKWEIMNITNNALTTYIPTAIVRTKLWNNTRWIIIAVALSKETPRTFTMWHYIDKTNYRIIIVDPLLYKELCTGDSYKVYNDVALLALCRLNFNIIGLRCIVPSER